jgi:hypothetical protein
LGALVRQQGGGALTVRLLAAGEQQPQRASQLIT